MDRITSFTIVDGQLGRNRTLAEVSTEHDISNMKLGPEIFYVSSHGMAGDHWFDWFPKAMGANSDILMYMGESVRSKYLKERSRKERPEIFAFTDFLRDLGAPYKAICECFAYRSYQLEPLKDRYGDRIRFVNLLRHPYCWIHFYIRWRVNNLNQPVGVTTAIDHEWKITCHEKFSKLDLKRYDKNDVEIWASYQAMEILNRMKTDLNPGVVNKKLEDLVESQSTFCETVHYLTHGKITYTQDELSKIFSWVQTPSRPGAIVLNDPAAERATWPQWKVDAYSQIVSDETNERFESLGYQL